MPAIEGDKEIKLGPGEVIAQKIELNLRKRINTGTGLKILTPNKLLTRLPILLAQVKAGNKSYKLRNEIFCISIIKSPKTLTTNESSHYNNGR